MKAFFKEYGIPLLVLLPLAVSVWIGSLFHIYFPICLVIGFVFKPCHIWVLRMRLVLALWIGGGVVQLAGLWPPQDPERPETYSSFLIESVV